MVKNTNWYNSMKAEYIQHSAFNDILETNIVMLERRLSALDPASDKIIDFVETDIILPGRKPETLRLLFFIHPETGDIAPFWLQLLRDPQRVRLGKAGARDALGEVLDELGW